jgi:iron-sulfur cluster repair protein YtfE (RIC family)
VRELLSRLRQELESHLSYEEKILFPLLKKRLPAGLLRELGAHSRADAAHGPQAR